MRIIMNGQTLEVDEGVSVRHCLETHNFLKPGDDVQHSAVVVELNRHIVYAENFAGTALTEGDVFEVLHFVGGG